jgi:hypothetical protein
MIGAAEAMDRQRFAHERAKAALHPVADDRAADLLGNRDAIADRAFGRGAGNDEQDEAGPGDPQAAVGVQKIAALA